MYVNELRAERSRQQFLRRLPTNGNAGFFACWQMQTCRPDGYAVFGDGDAFGTGERYTHRIVYRLVWGPIPERYEVDHRCFTRNCVNPLHLAAVPMPDNRARRTTTGIHKTHCPHGHAYDETNLYVNPTTGKRLCRECMREANRILRARGHALERTHCARGHLLDEENCYVYRGARICRECVRVRRRNAQNRGDR